MIPTSSIALFNQITTNFIADLGKSCLLYYPPVERVCPNCTNGFTYNGTGPISFTAGAPCPYCGGSNKVMQAENTDTVKMMVYFNPQDFIMYQGFQANIPNNLVQTRGLIQDLPKILRCDSAILNQPSAGEGQLRFMREGEWSPFGPMQAEFLQFWKRAT